MIDNISGNNKVLHNDRPTIGLLIESLSGSYQSGIWPGISEVAEKEGYNIVCFTGGALEASPDDPWEKQRNILYDIAEKNDLDGVLISGSLCSYVNESTIREFLQRFENIPAVTLLPLSDKIPSVYVDNKNGMSELINHLVHYHEYKRFAFVKGPDNNPEAEERLHLFQEILAGNDIFPTEEDYAEGSFNRESGFLAVDKFYKDKNPGYDVIVCADDDTAYGVIERLREYNLIVPDDVAVVGFDDAEESIYMTPPVTTVAQPLKELGRVACELLSQRIKGEEVPMETVLDAHIVERQSCGCFKSTVKKAQIKKALIEAVAAKNKIDHEKIENYILSKLERTWEIFPFDIPQVKELISDFCYDVNHQKSEMFLQSIDRIGRSKILKGSNLIKWNNLFTYLWKFSLSHLDRETYSFADALLHEARIIRGDLVLRAQGYRRIVANREYNYIHEIGEQISNTIDKSKLLNVIAETIPELNLNNFYVCYYNDSKSPLDSSILSLKVENGEKVELQDNVSFKTSLLLPEMCISSESVHTIVSEPLYFHDELFGIIYFLVDKLEYDTNIFEVLGNYISNALHSGYLIGKVQEQNRELERLRDKEHQYLKAIKKELNLGRKIQRSFLPQNIVQPTGYDLAVNFTPAREVSGDFYDVFELDKENLIFVIADVSGKDVSAAMFMAVVKTLLRVYSESLYKERKSPLQAIEQINEYVIEHHQQPQGRCMFVTMFFAIVNIATGELSYVNAGHNPAVIFNQKEIVKQLPPTAPAVGLAPGLPFPIESSNLGKGEFLYTYTDGVTEAQSKDNQFFSVERLLEMFSDNSFESASDVVETIAKLLEEFTEGVDPFDDITMVTVHRK